LRRKLPAEQPVVEQDVELLKRGLERAELEADTHLPVGRRLDEGQTAAEDLCVVVSPAWARLADVRRRGEIHRWVSWLALGIDPLANEVEPDTVPCSSDHLVARRVVGQRGELLRPLKDLQVRHVATTVGPDGLVELVAIAMNEDEARSIAGGDDVADAVFVAERLGLVEALIAALRILITEQRLADIG
jgi:hypothetical protein